MLLKEELLSISQMLQLDLVIVPLNLERVFAILQRLIAREDTEVVCAGFHWYEDGVLYVRIYVENETEDEPQIRGNFSPFWHDVCGVSIQCTLSQAIKEVAKNFPSAGSKGGTGGLEWVCFKSTNPPNYFPPLSSVLEYL
jgi:hypothetical protein